ncbi:MAG TPA: hypothetical protein ENN55_04200 [Firmicutes bacterium]|nr:hypothetical protein [Bacillota bacterium]
MGNVFKTSEIVDMGIEKEIKRRDFYAFAADKFKSNAELYKLFTNLRDWEETHIHKFEDIKKTVKNEETQGSFGGELKEYIESLINSTIYKEITPEKFGTLVKTPEDAVNFGISFEKDAILFFSELLPYVQPSLTDSVRQLIKEEKEHIIYLTKLKSGL